MNYLEQLNNLKSLQYKPSFSYKTNEYTVDVFNIGKDEDLYKAIGLINGDNNVTLDGTLDATKVLGKYGLTEDMIKNGLVNYDVNSGHLILKKENSFMSKYGEDITLGLGALNTGINLFNTIQNYQTTKLQRSALKEQIEAFKQQTQQANEEYNRIKNLRQTLANVYKG